MVFAQFLHRTVDARWLLRTNMPPIAFTARDFQLSVAHLVTDIFCVNDTVCRRPNSFIMQGLLSHCSAGLMLRSVGDNSLPCYTRGTHTIAVVVFVHMYYK